MEVIPKIPTPLPRVPGVDKMSAMLLSLISKGQLRKPACAQARVTSASSCMIDQRQKGLGSLEDLRYKDIRGV